MSPSKAFSPHVQLALVIIIVLGLCLLIDATIPLGTGVSVLYLLPTVIAFVAQRPVTPLLAAIAGVGCALAAYFIAPQGLGLEIALTNRAFSGVTNFLLAAIGFFLIRYRNASRHQQWLRESETDLSRATSGSLALSELGSRTLSFLAERFGAIAGALYVKEDGTFRRIATYGVPADALVPETIEPGESLLGEVMRHGRTTTLTQVPAGYLSFGTALGQATPATLVLGAAHVDETINAVIEIGFVNARDARPEDLVAFLDIVGGSLGITLRSAKYRARLEHLLSETQQQAEELQNQSEELRATNDELEAQSKLLLHSQTQLEEQQAELERSNSQLEEQAQSLEAQRDELTRSQTRLRGQADELEQASRYKSEFLANMSHELRTPLNSLLIMARLLADNRQGNLSGEQVRYAETIESSGNDLLTLINDVLDISKIEAGRLELEPHRVPVAAMLGKLENTFGAPASGKGLSLRMTAAEGVNEIETDPLRLEQVLKNFLSNAIKFTSHGEVSLTVAPVSSDRIAFSVRDTGPGIPEDQQDAIFEAFRQADGGIARKYGGTGLGLSISRELAHLLGGTISVDSTPGKGSTFTLELPVAFRPGDSASAPQIPGRTSPTPTPAATPTTAPATRRGPKPQDDRETLSGDSRVILIVEDDPAFARILCDLAHEVGFECLIAGTADEGALLARQYLPQAVILDMHLPDHTGLSVLDRIKRDARTRHIPVHIVSADHDDHAALASGAVGYLFKPVSRNSLMGMLEGLEARMDQRLRRVLVVEDDPRQAEAIHLLLASRDVETVDVQSAADCLARLGQETFDCMVLDLNLPDMSGLDLLERLSLDESVGFPPVIVYTGRELSDEEEMRLRRYSKSIIVKGAKSPERLLDEVTLFLHQVVSDLPDEKQQLLARSLGRDAALEGRQILVVEDDIRNIYALTSVLEPHGVHVRIARNGIEALNELARVADSDGGAVDLVLMDVMMPEMDGLTCTREIRKDPHWRSLPIIALTAKAMERDHRECLEAGANDYLSKPLDVDKLLSLVRVWMPR
ncbi:MAG: histidine kinase [Novosphingobium lindaniclasticum]|jgi:signal transduction histidine kinase/DNA-binding response OmpR family regulator|uniref:response regulator n=1 Tax=Novosphingobium lindaniclasticum TaxID=1329895 RepID=UPI002409C272|nr:response regulator [Novosphingobium lindaniclasticum]MDF2638893.1 histidine kinase [Novosphingobium lindaniclasticum]